MKNRIIAIRPTILEDEKIKNMDDHLFRRWIELQLAFIDDTSIDLVETYFRLHTSRNDLEVCVQKLHDLGFVDEAHENKIDFIPFRKEYYFGQILDTLDFAEFFSVGSMFNPHPNDLQLIQKYYTYLATVENAIFYIEHVPDVPGVYFFFDCEDELCYIGSSKNLDMRIPQSFREREGDKYVKSIAYYTTASTKDARAIEANMIFKYTPTFNESMPNVKIEGYIPDVDAYALDKEKVQVFYE